MKQSRRALAVLAIALAAAPVAHAQGYPARPVRIVVPYPPGGAVDAVTRKMAAKLQEQTGQAFFVENKPGATGTIGILSVVGAAPDGYTLVANDTTYSLLPHIFKSLKFDHARDLAPVGAYVFAPMTVAVKADSKYRTLADLIAAAKAAPQTITYGTGGAGSTPHFSTEALGIAAGANFLHVPYKGAGEATIGVLGGTIDFQLASTPGVMSQVKGGRMRLLAVTGDQRSAALPDVPTLSEAGVRGLSIVNFTGLWAPKGTPADVLAKLQAEIARAMATRDMRDYAESIGAEPGHWDGATFAKALAERTAFWGRIASNTKFERE